MEIKMDPVLTEIENINKCNKSFLVYNFLVKDLTYAIEKFASGKLIDIGCGNKPYEKLFTGKITEYTGCDFNQTKLGTVDIICDATNIPLPDESFDTAFCTQVIEHVADHQGMLNEAFRLLRPGGHLILSGPLYWPVHGEPNDYFRFTKFGFEYVLKKAGFTIVDTISNGGIWASSGQALIHAFEFSESRSFFFRSIRFIFFRLRLIWLVNTLFKWMDRKDFNPVNTINYVLIAQKNEK